MTRATFLHFALALTVGSGCARDPLDGLRFACDPEWDAKGMADPCGAGCECRPTRDEAVPAFCACGPTSDIGGDPGDATPADATAPDTTAPDTTAPDATAPDATACSPECTDRECGSDGCGGSCGTCLGGIECASGVCSTSPLDMIDPGDVWPLSDEQPADNPGTPDTEDSLGADVPEVPPGDDSDSHPDDIPAEDSLLRDAADVDAAAQAELPMADGSTDRGPEDEGIVAPDEVTATGDVGDEVPVDVQSPDVQGVDCLVDVLVDVQEVPEIVEPDFCPPPAALPGSEVCVLDGTTKTEYASDRFAKCGECADGPGCRGCSGTRMDCTDLPTSNYFTWRGKCDICPCVVSEECDRLGMGGMGCGNAVCALKNGVHTEYADLCSMKADFGCIPGYDDNLTSFGPCPKPGCEVCIGQPVEPVCGSDGRTYDNQCSLVNCPSMSGVTRACQGVCIGSEFCPSCPACSSPEEVVCGDDGVTYGNACAATACGTRDKLVEHVGPCCTDCEEQPLVEVCAADGRAYKNLCAALCAHAEPCGYAGPVVCGYDGQQYANECWAMCKAGGKLHDGECLRVCEQCPVGAPTDYSPVCGLDRDGKSRTYQSECFMTCQGGTDGNPGICQACTELCESATSAVVCGADGITYPNACIPEKCMLLPAPTPGACVLVP